MNQNEQNEQDKQYKVVLVKCRRGSEPSTYGQECQSTQAYNMSDSGSTVVRFKCVKCGHIWVIPIGGSMRLPDGC